MKSKIKFICDLLRVKQWVKNTFIFFPLIFSGQLFLEYKLTSTILAFGGFCFIASGLYVFNDYRDRHQDQLHPKKSKRPLARIKFTKTQVAIIIFALLSIGLLICSQVN